MGSLIKILGYLVAFSIVPCAFLFVRKHVALKRAELCKGVVLAHEPRSESDGTTYALRVEYRHPHSGAHSFVTGSSSNPPACAIGEKVTVFHHSAGRQPDILVFSHLFLGYWIWFCISVCVIGCLCASSVIESFYVK